jgi:hypothetical protein
MGRVVEAFGNREEEGMARLIKLDQMLGTVPDNGSTKGAKRGPKGTNTKVNGHG